MKQEKSFQFYIITLILLFFNVLIIMFPDNVMLSARNGALLWYKSVLPSLFPFMFAMNMLINTSFAVTMARLCEPLAKRLFRISGIGALAYISGICSGYPVGAKSVSNMLENNMIERDEAQRLITFCNNSGPLFIIGTVGSLFSDIHCGYIMLFIHILSSFITGLLFRNMGSFSPRKNMPQVKRIPFAQLFSQSIADAGEAVIKICGYIIIFSVISGFLSKTGIGNSGFLMGILEMTNGCSILSQDSSTLSKALACSVISWGGLSIHAQTFEIIGKAGLSKKLYIFSKLIQAVLSFSLFYIIYSLLF